ncbi:MAG: hypothetical protein GY926_09085 [bacterium]|nr:hypothetical protein [bacterium]MCP4965375.1 hypothetical protein [bacterium]
MSTVETLVRQLADVQDQLVALPNDAFEQRFELVQRQEELRSQAAEHAEGADRERTTEDLLAELANLRIRQEKRPDTQGRMGRIKGILIGRGVDPS